MLIIKKKNFRKWQIIIKNARQSYVNFEHKKGIKHKPSTIFQDQREYLHDDLKNMFLIPREHYS